MFTTFNQIFNLTGKTSNTCNNVSTESKIKPYLILNKVVLTPDQTSYVITRFKCDFFYLGLFFFWIPTKKANKNKLNNK